MNVGSLFSGIGGLDLGLERAGMRVAWCCESDPYARAVLGRRFPGATLYPDVRDLRATHVAPVDLLCGGFPCQDLSYAGRGAGLAGERSGLWREFARLVREIRPRYVLVENVPALRGRGLGVVLGDLAALGFDAEWDCLPASAFGAPHQRDRIFIVAYPEREGLAGLVEGDCVLGGQVEAQPEHFNAPPFAWDSLDVDPVLLRARDGVSRRVERLRGLGNAVVPQVAEFIGRRILAHAGEA